MSQITIIKTEDHNETQGVDRPSRRFNLDVLVHIFVALCALTIVALIAGLLVVLVSGSWLSIEKSGWKFLTSSAWNPVTGEYGALASLYGTVVTTVIALALAIPLSLAIALFLVEIAPPKVATIVGGAIELLAAIPSIIFGMWGLFLFAPFMADHVQPFMQKYTGDFPLFSSPLKKA